jgi:hypothetical protein
MADLRRVNGAQISWGSLVVKVNGDRFYGFTSIDYGDKLEVAYAYGMGRHQMPRGRSRGKYVPDPVKLKGPKASCEALRQALAAGSPTGTSYGVTEFEISVSYSESFEPPLSVDIGGCRYVGTKEAHAEGSEVLEDEIEISPMSIRRNGLVLFDESEGSL